MNKTKVTVDQLFSCGKIKCCVFVYLFPEGTKMKIISDVLQSFVRQYVGRVMLCWAIYLGGDLVLAICFGGVLSGPSRKTAPGVVRTFLLGTLPCSSENPSKAVDFVPGPGTGKGVRARWWCINPPSLQMQYCRQLWLGLGISPPTH